MSNKQEDSQKVETVTLKARGLVDGNIICLGNKNLIVFKGDDGEFFFKDLRSEAEFVLFNEYEEDTGVRALIELETSNLVYNHLQQQIKVIVLSTMIVDITGKNIL